MLEACQATYNNGSETKTASDVLVSTTSGGTVFSCFSVDWKKDKESMDVSKDNVVQQRQDCCEGIQLAQKTLFIHAHDVVMSQSKLLSKASCLLELSEMPLFGMLSQMDTTTGASFSWWVPVSMFPRNNTVQGKPQLLFRMEQNELQTIHNPISPYHLSMINDGDEQRLVSLPSSSTLDPNGGMHRLLHHSIQLQSDVASTYVFVLVVPQGMFIDLDDPMETGKGLIAIPRQSSPEKTMTKCSFNLQSDIASPTVSLHLYATDVCCDIEQPAFVSGQHVLAWEFDLEAFKGESLLLEFATKLHMRYSQPSPNLHQWVHLPSPLLLGVVGKDVDTTVISVETQYMEVLERIQVAAGNDDDHDFVMWITMASCLLGVLLMLQDISKMSLWDDV
jgi:hypothetical protein